MNETLASRTLADESVAVSLSAIERGELRGDLFALLLHTLAVAVGLFLLVVVFSNLRSIYPSWFIDPAASPAEWRKWLILIPIFTCLWLFWTVNRREREVRRAEHEFFIRAVEAMVNKKSLG